jgi:membrane associated rhomboid family serine protease
MALGKPDPRYTQSRRARSSFRLALKTTLIFIGILWTIFIFDAVFGLRLGRFGLRPGSVSGLIGILSAPLLHGSFQHLLSNTIPLLVSLTATLYLYPASSVRVIPLLWLGSGAIGLIYGMLAYVFVGGILRRDMRSVSVSLLVGFLYGSMIWGVLPIRPNMSWEMHLGGAMMGCLLAILYRRWDQVPLVRYDWEDDDAVPEWYPETSEDDPDRRRPH